MTSAQSIYAGYPVKVDARLDEPLSRWLWLFKWFLAIPHYIVLAFLWVAFVVLSIVAFFAIVLTGQYPPRIFAFNVGVLRWSWRVSYYAYGALATDRYPPFTLDEDPNFPAHLEISYPDHLSRGLPFVKWLLALPHLLIVAFLVGGSWVAWQGLHVTGGVISLLAFVAAIVVLVGAGYPKGLFDVILGLNRWVLRVAAYTGLMTDSYPPFRLDVGGSDPAGTLMVSTAPPQSPAGIAPPPVPFEDRGPPPPPALPPMRSTWTGGRIAAVVVGSLLAIASLGVTVAGGTLLWADLGLRDDAGYVNTGTETFSTGTYAVATERIVLPVEGPWGDAPAALGNVRLRITPTDARSTTFVGIASAEDVAAYLDGVPHAVTRDVADDRLRTVAGTRSPARPAIQSFWVASSVGTGTRTLGWKAEEGTWSIVAMNADASGGVSVRASVGATVPALRPIAIGLLAGGGVFLLIGAALTIGGLTSRGRS